MPCSEDDDSQTGFMSEPSQGMSKAELRKPARHSKLEKADILEMTVKHLQRLQRQQLAAAIAADPAVLHRFKSGFGDCALEVRRYLSRLASVPTGLRYRLGDHLNSCLSGIERLHPADYPPLVPDPLRLDDERPSAFHFVKSTKPTSPPLSPLSCDSACDSSTELETPPRPVKKFPFPTPPSRSASDQDSSPEQKPTVSSTTISPESLQQEGSRTKKFMEPLSIVIDVENYKIGIDASPKRAVDYSIRQKLKRPSETIGPVPKLIRLEPERKVPSPERAQVDRIVVLDRPEKISAFRRIPTAHERKLTLPVSIPAVVERPSLVLNPVQRSVISHTAESLAQSSTSRAVKQETKETSESSNRPKSPEQGSSSSTEMWRPW
ncbi:Protein deadpan [Papilio machaon]|uniref:Protein deadpan n=1 Tax=Papilio machaon TaxID=76193 RepID=A0A0N0PEG2_PAPMA|nr:Protein deadpan [Papilio machaon]